MICRLWLLVECLIEFELVFMYFISGLKELTRFLSPVAPTSPCVTSSPRKKMEAEKKTVEFKEVEKDGMWRFAVHFVSRLHPLPCSVRSCCHFSSANIHFVLQVQREVTKRE